jgi:hypothetical protein
MPVVFCDAETGLVSLLANRVSDYVKRLCCESDFLHLAAAPGLVEAANGSLPPKDQYELGSVHKFSRGLEVYCALRIAAFPSTYRALAASHKSKGDVASALVTCEKAASVFEAYGESHAFQAQMLQREPGYELEARDAARSALSKPLWTMGGALLGFPDDSHTTTTTTVVPDMVHLAGKASVGEYLSDLKRAKESSALGGGGSGAGATQSPQEAALDQAAFAMDCHVLEAFAWAGAAAAGSQAPIDWASMRPRLVGICESGGLTELSVLVRGE